MKQLTKNDMDAMDAMDKLATSPLFKRGDVVRSRIRSDIGEGVVQFVFWAELPRRWQVCMHHDGGRLGHVHHEETFMMIRGETRTGKETQQERRMADNNNGGADEPARKAVAPLMGDGVNQDGLVAPSALEIVGTVSHAIERAAVILTPGAEEAPLIVYRQIDAGRLGLRWEAWVTYSNRPAALADAGDDSSLEHLLLRLLDQLIERLPEQGEERATAVAISRTASLLLERAAAARAVRRPTL